jgi:transcriptional regulator with XRE-family HTH domain
MSGRKLHDQKLHNRKLHNRLRAVMSHTIRYAFKGETRLAEDAGISKSALNRLINGQSSPSFALVCALAEALSKRLKRRIEPSELVSCDGAYPTRYVCALCGCNGCLPGEAYDDEENLRSEYSHIKPGQWSTEDFPALGESEVE